MRIISLKTLREAWEKHPTVKPSLQAFYHEAHKADWVSMDDIKKTYPHASIIDSERVVFNISGNNYRLIVKIWFPARAIYIKFFGSHAEYDKIDVSSL